jgi:Domain of unknown function (DUF6398)
MEKQKVDEQKQKILALVREFCAKKLNEEYFELAERLIQKLGRKRNVPFISGKPEIWAAGIIQALGTINFLFDKSFEPYVSVDDINNFFRTSKSTTGNKSKQIRDLLKLDRWNNEFSTKQMQESNPFSNFVMVNGFIVSIDNLPEEYQQIVKQARAEGKDISFTTK